MAVACIHKISNTTKDSSDLTPISVGSSDRDSSSDLTPIRVIVKSQLGKYPYRVCMPARSRTLSGQDRQNSLVELGYSPYDKGSVPHSGGCPCDVGSFVVEDGAGILADEFVGEDVELISIARIIAPVTGPLSVGSGIEPTRSIGKIAIHDDDFAVESETHRLSFVVGDKLN